MTQPVILPRDSRQRILWTQVKGFLDWLRADGPRLTNQELIVEVQRRWGATLNPCLVASLRRRHGAVIDPEARRRGYNHRDAAHRIELASAVVPSFVRELGPQDENYFVKVTGDCFVTSDWHIPHQKDSLVDHLCEMAEAWRVPTLIINGDFLNQDAFSKWKHHRFNVPWQEEKGIARDVLKRLLEVFKELVYVMDNHDRRIIAANEHPSEFTESDVIELLTWGVKTRRLRPSIDYHYVTVNDTWRVTSPKEYRRIKLSLPNRIAQMYHQNVIVGGDHLFGLGMDDSGRYVIANSMCMIDPQRTPYISVQDTTFPHWNPGFYLIRNNRLLAFPDNPSLTDWAEAIRTGELLHEAKRSAPSKVRRLRK